jgi:hypothetical protein
MLTTDEQAFKRWLIGVSGLAGGFIAGFPADAAALVHLHVSPEIVKWVGITLTGGSGIASPSVLTRPPQDAP